MEKVNGIFSYSCNTNFSVASILQAKLEKYQKKNTAKEQHLHILDCVALQKSDVSLFYVLPYYTQ